MKSFVVLGLGRFGKSVAKSLYDSGHEVLAVDDDMAIIQSISGQVTHAIQADITDEEFLLSIDIDKFDAAIVAVGSNMQVSIMVTVLLKELGAKYILVKAQDDFEEKVLYKLGADNVILPESDMGAKVAFNLVSDNLFDNIELSPDYSIASVTPPDSWHGKTIGKLSVRAHYGVNIIAIKTGETLNIAPEPNTIITADMTMTVMGSNSNLKRLQSVK